ncbi:hypothetical protein BH09BAC5_BH09BAC5_05740 [soil metagenome]
MSFRVFHHRKKCIGCYACIIVAGERWKMSRKDGKSILINGKETKGMYSAIIGDHELESNRNAEKICPVKIIRVNKTREEK